VRLPGPTHLVITVSGHHLKRRWAERALQRLQEQFAPIGVELNREKTKVVNTLKGSKRLPIGTGSISRDQKRCRAERVAGIRWVDGVVMPSGSWVLICVGSASKADLRELLIILFLTVIGNRVYLSHATSVD
jgi:hypothetical protein